MPSWSVVGQPAGSAGRPPLAGGGGGTAVDVGAGVLPPPPATTESVPALLFQCGSAAHPGVNTPIFTVYAPGCAEDGTDHGTLYVRVCPAVNAWLSKYCWCDFAPAALDTSTSISALDALALVIDAEMVTVVPAFTAAGETDATVV
jgi:hypothetical protein